MTRWQRWELWLQEWLAIRIASWIAYRNGIDLANDWLWSWTPFPIWVPSWSQLWEGFWLFGCRTWPQPRLRSKHRSPPP